MPSFKHFSVDHAISFYDASNLHPFRFFFPLTPEKTIRNYIPRMAANIRVFINTFIVHTGTFGRYNILLSAALRTPESSKSYLPHRQRENGHHIEKMIDSFFAAAAGPRELGDRFQLRQGTQVIQKSQVVGQEQLVIIDETKKLFFFHPGEIRRLALLENDGGFVAVHCCDVGVVDAPALVLPAGA